MCQGGAGWLGSTNGSPQPDSGGRNPRAGHRLGASLRCDPSHPSSQSPRIGIKDMAMFPWLEDRPDFSQMAQAVQELDSEEELPDVCGIPLTSA